MKQYFVAVNTLHNADFTQNCTRTKENRINLFTNTNFVDFRTDPKILRENE